MSISRFSKIRSQLMVALLEYLNISEGYRSTVNGQIGKIMRGKSFMNSIMIANFYTGVFYVMTNSQYFIK